MRWALVLILIPCSGCAVEPSESARSRAESETIVSFLGEPLSPAALPEEVRVDHESKLAEARATYEADPEDVDALIWLGRRLAYLGRYQEAIDIYSKGIEQHPEDPRLFRHRGHRYITTRRLDLAIADLELAAGLIESTPDEIEPDGLPNAAGIPTSTLQSNIWYHLGLARYLEGDFEAALHAYEEGLAVSNNPDMLVATSHWLYMTLRRLGLEPRAREVLEPITIDLRILENHEYHQLLLMVRNEIPAQEIWPRSGDGISSATLGYGVGSWHLYNGRTEEAEEVFLRILEGEQWAAFGFIAAEAEIARTEGRGPK